MRVKRLFDLAGATAGLLLLWPLLLVIGLWIRRDSPGPALFRQQRVGRHGRPFTIYKFRTMVVGAERGPGLSCAADARVTRAGAWLRRTKLDELPQLLNVLRGDMSLVGPRPDLPRYIAWLAPAARQRVLELRPGMTDWASLHFRHENDMLDGQDDPEHVYREQILPIKLGYWLAYAERRSLAEDLRIIGATLALLLQLRPAPSADPDSWRGVVLNLLRGLAACEVAAAHLRGAMWPALAQIPNPSLPVRALVFGTGFAHQAVVAFFVLSGWLVGGGLLAQTARPGLYQRYAADRLSRLWCVLVPCLALSLLLAIGRGQADPMQVTFTAEDSYGPLCFIGNLFGLQTQAVPVFAGNGPLWSLANETRYYLLFPLLLFGMRSPAGPRALAWGAAAALVLASPLDLNAYFLVWLLGAVASRMPWRTGWPLAATIGAAWLSLSIVLRFGSHNADLDLGALGQDTVLGTLLALTLASIPTDSGPRTAATRALARAAAGLAAISFSLYVMHVPLQQTLLDWWPAARGRLDAYLLLLGAVIVGSVVAWSLGEAHTARVRRRLRPGYAAPPSVPAGGPHSSAAREPA